ncbi:MAG: hypothetical protein HRF50_12180 [Phycisphaerae bacterium]|jgi:hypothetical protein
MSGSGWRTRSLAGAALLVGAAWVADSLRSAQPESASSAAVPSPAALKAEASDDVAELIRALEKSELASSSSLTLTRDPFALTPVLQRAASRPTLAAASAPAEEAAEQLESSTPALTLQGVVTGPTPLALLDGMLYPANAVVGEWRVSEIRRDRVRLTRGTREVWLVLAPPE